MRQQPGDDHTAATMTVFISHSFQDRPIFDNLVADLDHVGVPYWDPDRIRPSGSLRDQLRETLASCPVCIFIATANSVRSAWCLTELGAFWGQQRPIVVYLADPSLDREQLPEIVRDTVWDPRIRRIAEEARRLLEAAESFGTAPPVGLNTPQLEELIVGIVSLLRAGDDPGPDGPGAAPAGDDVAELRSAAQTILRGHQVTRGPAAAGRRRCLWVDERPGNNVFERRAIESAGLPVAVAGSVGDAVGQLARSHFATVVACLGDLEGYYFDLLDRIRLSDRKPPLFIYANLNPVSRQECLARGAAGVTNNHRELVAMVLKALVPEPGRPGDR